MKKLILLLFLALISVPLFAKTEERINVAEVDGTPSLFPYKLKVANGSLVDGGDGTATLGAAGADTQVIFNDSGVEAGNSKLIFAKTTGQLTATGPIVSSGAGTSYVTGLKSGLEFDTLREGAIRLSSTGNTNNEKIDIDLETDADVATISSPTGVTDLVWEEKFRAKKMDVGSTSNIDVSDAIISYYRLEENAATTTVFDEQNLNNGTASGNTSTFTIAGLNGNAFSFSSRQVDLGSFTNKPSTGDFCIELWVKTSASGVAQRIAGNRASSGSNEGWEFALLTTGLARFDIDLGASGQPTIDSTSVINNGNWNHVVGCRESDVGAIYINGASEGVPTTSFAGDPSIGAGNTYLGGTPQVPLSFVGSIDTVRFFNRALSLAEIQYLYNAGDGQEEVETGGIITTDESLNIGGNIAMTGNIYAEGNVGIGSATSPDGRLVVTGSSDGATINTQSKNLSGDALWTVYDNGRAKLGTGAPTEMLEVDGNVKASSLLIGGVGSSFAYDLTSATVAYYKMEDNAGSTTVTDTVGPGTHNGTAGSNTSTMTTTGKLSNGFHFEASETDQIDLGSSSDFKFAGDFCIDGFLKTTATTSKRIIGSRLSSGTNPGIEWVLVSTGKFRFTIDVGATISVIESASTINTGDWFHFLTCRESGVGQLWVNRVAEGTPSASFAYDLSSSSGNMVLGGTPFSPNEYTGDMDNIRFFNRALTTEERDAIWNDGAGTEDLSLAGSAYNIFGTTTTAVSTHSFNSLKDVYIEGNFEVDGSTYFDGQYFKTVPTAEVIAGAATITANACGGIKQITSSGNVTTNTTNTFTAPAAGNKGCCMKVINTDSADTITLDNNANFVSSGATDVALGPGDTAEVCSNATTWYQIGPTGNN